MCISCGCGQPNDDHGDSRNITLDDVNQAAEAAGTTRDRVLQNIMGGAGSQTPSPSSSTEQSQQPNEIRGSSSDQLMGSSQQQGEPGEKVPSPGHDSGTSWGQGQERGQVDQNEQQDPQGMRSS